nr:MAG TPA: hypothetical protein [Caudoviricetes sp.]
MILFRFYLLVYFRFYLLFHIFVAIFNCITVQI